MIFEAKLNLPDGALAPDSYDGSIGLIPPDDFVISRNPDGSILSRYKDMVWNLTPYHPDGRSSLLRFPYWDSKTLTPAKEQLIRVAHWLMFLMMYKHGSPLSFSSLSSYLGLIRAMAKFSEKNSCGLIDVLTDAKRFLRFIDSGIPGSMIVILSCLLSTLLRLGVEQTGFETPVRSVFKELSKRIEEYANNTRQHPPIPTRIYSRIINGLMQELDDFEAVADRYLALVVLCAGDPLIGRCKERQRIIARKLGRNVPLRLDFQDLLLKYDLKDYFSNKGLPQNMKGLSTGLGCVQKTAKLLIQAFSGMRDAEALSLPYYSKATLTSNGRYHYLILGKTTKLNKGKIKRTRWVTNSEGHRAINVGMRIADTIYGVLGVKPQKNVSRTNCYPLFVSSAYLPLSGGKVANAAGRYLSAMLSSGSLVHYEKIKASYLPVIENGDLQELEQIDPHRAWRTEVEFNIGSPWPLTSHQLRRSLALYAQRSGLVSLPSLRRQLQHITEEMSRYYSRGSAFAQNFIGDDKDHFGREWQSNGPISAALSYTINVLFTDEVLFGGHVDWIKNRLCGSDGTIIVDREETLLRFKKGELSYKETFLGGCTNTGECKQTALKWLDVDCLVGCSNLVGNLSKLEKAITAQTKLVNSLDITSIDYRTEKADLDVLISTHTKVLTHQRQMESV